MRQILDFAKRTYTPLRLMMLLVIGAAMALDHLFGQAVAAYGLAMAATADVDTPQIDGRLFSYPVAAAKNIYGGTIVVLDSSGNAEPGATATGKIAVGRCEAQADNSDGDAADINVTVKEGVFRFANSADADEITKAEIGDACYIVDDMTVAKTSATNTRSIAGSIRQVDSDGVWVELKNTFSKDGDVVAANNLSDVTAGTARSNIGANKVVLSLRATALDGTLVYGVVSPVAGTISKIHSVLKGAALATGDATLTGKIGGVAITNGVVTITQAGSAIGDKDSATPSAANVVAVGDEIQFLVGGTNSEATAFAEVSILILT